MFSHHIGGSADRAMICGAISAGAEKEKGTAPRRSLRNFGRFQVV